MQALASPLEGEHMLVISDLTKIYKSGRGIFDLNLSLKKGDVYGLLGPNGAGKTTLLKTIAGLQIPNKGTCVNEGVDSINNPATYKSHMVGMIGDTALYEYLTAMDHMKMMEVHRPDMSTAEQEAMLAEMALLDYKDEKTKQFSTGMKQRLAFAMCMVTKPSLLLLDEPFSGLDIEGKLLVRKSIENLRNQGDTAILISSHLIHDIEEIATEVGVIKEGRLIDEQHVGDVLQRYRNLEGYFVEQTIRFKEGA